MSLKIVLIQANCADPDLMPPYQAAFDLGLHCLSKDLFTGKKMRRVNSMPTSVVC